jgi:phosphatidylethanolamine-binding protein (PEBP) family uncharacterized protein
VKSYTVNLYALSENLSLKNTEATQKNLLVAMNGKVIATSSLTVFYERS